MKPFTRHYLHINGSVLEGGNARTFAIARLLAEAGAAQRKFTSKTRIGRMIDGIRLVIFLLFEKKQIILIHYSLFPTLFSSKLVSNKFISRQFGCFLQHIASRNKLYVEVNDLPHEQAVDLELQDNNMNIFDSALFTRSMIYYIFASSEMARYAISKYAINKKYASVLINGAWPISEKNEYSNLTPSASQLRFVYAGTLNPGRQIRLMIESFITCNHSLILMGTDGEWIAKEYSFYKNIQYIGPLIESEAQKVVARCDIGLIPYDENRWYYNICFPTKASFYIVCGIPFLSPPLIELKKYFSDDVVIYKSLKDWPMLLAEPNLESKVIWMKTLISDSVRNRFSWANIWNGWVDSEFGEGVTRSSDFANVSCATHDGQKFS